MSALFLVFGIAFVLSLIPLAFLILRRYVQARGPRAIVCPATVTPEIVEVDAAHTAWTGLFTEAEFRLNSCSRWPQRPDCGQDCVAQIEWAADGCLVRERVARWYDGAACVLCRKSFGEVHWFDRRPALLGPQGQLRAWSEIDLEDLAETLATHLPLCFDCHVAETFRARFPDLVIDDPRPQEWRKCS